MKVIQLEKLPVKGQGHGRLITLKENLTLKEVVERTKKHCGIQNLRLAVARGKDMGNYVIN